MSKSKSWKCGRELICEATRGFVLDARDIDCGLRNRGRFLFRRVRRRVYYQPSNARHAEFHAKREPIRRLAGTFFCRARLRWSGMVARKQKMDADLFIYAHCLVHRRAGRARD